MSHGSHVIMQNFSVNFLFNFYIKRQRLHKVLKHFDVKLIFTFLIFISTNGSSGQLANSVDGFIFANDAT